MNNKIPLLFIVSLLAGCGDDDAIECSSTVSTQALTDVLKKSAMQQISQETASVENATNAIRRSALEKIVFDVSNITTTSKDPNSSLRTCAATVSIKISPEEYNSLSEFSRENYKYNLDKVMERLNLEQNANVFSTQVNYTVQPTDDKKTVFVKVAVNNGASAGAAYISTLSILKPIEEQNKIEQEKRQQ
ncbi:hypothetical protein ACQ8YR_004325, partial [Yersinia enterocolitica]